MMMDATASLATLLATSTAAPVPPPVPELGLGSYLLNLVLVTVLMLALGWVSLRLTRNGRMPGLGLGPSHIKVVDRVMLDPKRALMVVNLGKRHWLVGMTEGSFSAIAEVSEADLAGDFESLVAEATPYQGKRQWWHRLVGLGLAAAAVLVAAPAMAQGANPTDLFNTFDLRVPFNVPNMTTSVQLIFLLAMMTILPFLVVMTTSFMRTIIVLGFLRQALGTQSIPPNPVMLGLAIFLAFYTMAPVWETIDKTALQPYLARQIPQPEMIAKAQVPLKEFMLRQTAQSELGFFLRLSRSPAPNVPMDVPFHVVVPAFMVSELTTAFKIGFVIYVPFIVIDLVVSNVLLALGMSSLPPQMISNAFKLLIFTLANGWHLVMSALVQSFK